MSDEFAVLSEVEPPRTYDKGRAFSVEIAGHGTVVIVLWDDEWDWYKDGELVDFTLPAKTEEALLDALWDAAWRGTDNRKDQT